MSTVQQLAVAFAGTKGLSFAAVAAGSLGNMSFPAISSIKSKSVQRHEQVPCPLLYMFRVQGSGFLETPKTLNSQHHALTSEEQVSGLSTAQGVIQMAVVCLQLGGMDAGGEALRFATALMVLLAVGCRGRCRAPYLARGPWRRAVAPSCLRRSSRSSAARRAPPCPTSQVSWPLGCR